MTHKAGDTKIDKKRLAAILNEWMRRYLEDTEAFDERFQELIREYRHHSKEAEEPAYGQICVHYIDILDAELPK